jgi:hypothetical protein
MATRTKSAQTMRTAYHEAGHAVAAVLLRVRFVSATIEPGAGSLGAVLMADHSRRLVELRQAGIVTPAMRQRLMDRATVSYAGAAGAGIAAGTDWDWNGAGQDERDVWHYLTVATPDIHHPEDRESPALQALADYCRARALDLIHDNADRVRRLADALIEHRTLKARRVRAIVTGEDSRPLTDSERATMERLRQVAIRDREQGRRERLIRELAKMSEGERESLMAQARAAATGSSNTPRRTRRGSEGK